MSSDLPWSPCPSKNKTLRLVHTARSPDAAAGTAIAEFLDREDVPSAGLRCSRARLPTPTGQAAVVDGSGALHQSASAARHRQERPVFLSSRWLVLVGGEADPEQKSRLAAQAVQSALTVDELKVAIAAGKVAEPGAKKRGRPPLPAVVKATEPVSKAMAMLKLWNAAKVAALAADEREYALGLARDAARELAVWMALLEAGGPSGE